MKEKDFKILINKKNQIYIREEAFKIDRIEVTSEIKKSFHIFFNENKYELLKSIVLKIVPEEIKNKYHLNIFLINVAIKMYENDVDKFKRNAKAVGASEEELKKFDDLASRARLVFDVDSYLNSVCDVIDDLEQVLIRISEINYYINTKK